MIAIITRMFCGLIRSSQAAPFWGWPMPTERIAMQASLSALSRELGINPKTKWR